MDSYQLTFKNEADSKNFNLPSVVTLAVYQAYPDTPELVTVAWKRGSASYGQVTNIRWKYKFNAILSDYYDGTGVGVYSSSQKLDAKIKDVFEVIDNKVSYLLLILKDLLDLFIFVS